MKNENPWLLDAVLDELEKRGYQLKREWCLNWAPQQIEGYTPEGYPFYYRYRWGSGALVVILDRHADIGNAVDAWEYPEEGEADITEGEYMGMPYVLIPLPEGDPFQGGIHVDNVREAFRRYEMYIRGRGEEK